tara:strand:- start:169 stop:546 length:378 start_codon:yes stop_codon:yes gene_type:complete
MLNIAYLREKFYHVKFNLVLVKTPEDLKKGLMNVQNLEKLDGMLFDFGEMKFNSLWMKNTLIPLDAVFMDENYVMVGFVRNMIPQSLNSYGIGRKSRYIAEINAGEIDEFDLKIGEKLQFNLNSK